MDWGLAKELSRNGTAEPQACEPREGGDPVRRAFAMGSTVDDVKTGVVGTPAYMPPEQAIGATDAVDERTDVFGLGAILCEILTGKPPYTGKDLLQKAQQADLAGAFTLLDTSGAERELIELAKRCLAKSPQERPRNAQEVRDALQSFRATREEQAREDRERRVAAEVRAGDERRRQRLKLMLAVVTLLALLGSLAAIVYFQHLQKKAAEDKAALANKEAEREKERAGELEKARALAQKEATKAKRFANFLAAAFEEGDPLGVSGYGALIPQKTGTNPTIGAILDKRTPEILKDESLDDETRAMLMDKIGNAYLNMSQLDRAEQLLEEAYELRKRELGTGAADTLTSRHSLGRLYHVRGDFFRAERCYREVLEGRSRLEPLPVRDLADTEFNLGWLLAEMEVYEEARKYLDDAR